MWSYLGMLVTALYVPHQRAFWCRLAGVDSTAVFVVLSVMVQVIPETKLTGGTLSGKSQKLSSSLTSWWFPNLRLCQNHYIKTPVAGAGPKNVHFN